jgi:hypothetical protein
VIYDTEGFSTVQISDTAAPRSAYDYLIEAHAKTHITFLFLDTTRTYIRTLANDEFTTGFYAFRFSDGNTLEKDLRRNHFYVILRIENDAYDLRKGLWPK